MLQSKMQKPIIFNRAYQSCTINAWRLIAYSRPALLAGGVIKSCGSGRNGRLGNGSQASCSEFLPIEALEEQKLLHVASGLDHSMLLVETHN